MIFCLLLLGVGVPGDGSVQSGVEVSAGRGSPDLVADAVLDSFVGLEPYLGVSSHHRPGRRVVVDN